ncbi:MAG: VWA domain-containing protein [Blastocatellia bacterium]|nr:VWA domain-containing protein [Blastocatellia bacterium]
MKQTLTLILFLLFSVNSLLAQERKEEPEDIVKIDSELVVIDVSVLDNKNRFVSTLDKSQFQVFEDGKEQKVELFSKEDVPVSFGLVVDTSGSMRFKLKTVLEAANKLLDLCKPNDEVFVVDMKDAIRINFLQKYTNNMNEARAAFGKMYPNGGTALLDGIAAAGNYAQESSSNRRRAIIVLSDGDERDSTIKQERLIELLRELQIQVYMVGFPEGFIELDGTFLEAATRKSRDLMRKIADESGGQAFFPKSLDEVGEIMTKIGQELRAQYMLGYYPINETKDGRWRKLQVKLNNKKYSVRTRSGYFAK